MAAYKVRSQKGRILQPSSAIWRVQFPHVPIGRKAGQQETQKLSKHEVRNMNELLNIAHKLNNEYGNCGHWEIVKAEKTENGWNLTIQPIEEKDGEADNESK